MPPRNHSARAASSQWTTVLLILVAIASTGCLAGPDEEPVATDTVRIPGAWVFEPRHIEISNGTVVTWTNDGGQPHTVTFETLGIDETLAPGERLELTFDDPGTYRYTCRFHPPDMVGSVRVTTG